jgi:hypothetical protein
MDEQEGLYLSGKECGKQSQEKGNFYHLPLTERNSRFMYCRMTRKNSRFLMANLEFFFA